MVTFSLGKEGKDGKEEKPSGEKSIVVIIMKNYNNEYNHSGDDGKEDPPVPIPNTEVKLFYAESTCRLLPGG